MITCTWFWQLPGWQLIPRPRAPLRPLPPSLSLYRSQVPMAEAEISQEKPRSDSNLKFFMGQTTGVLLALKLPVLEEGVTRRGRGGRGEGWYCDMSDRRCINLIGMSFHVESLPATCRVRCEKKLSWGKLNAIKCQWICVHWHTHTDTA